MKTMKTLIMLEIIGIIIFFTSCSSMTPVQVHDTLPTLTKSTFLSQSQADEAVQSNKCKFLNKNRTYVAPIGFTAKDDLRNGAKGIDEWVTLDGGNSYVLKNFKWITLDYNGTSQLHLDFDALKCE